MESYVFCTSCGRDLNEAQGFMHTCGKEYSECRVVFDYEMDEFQNPVLGDFGGLYWEAATTRETKVGTCTDVFLVIIPPNIFVGPRCYYRWESGEWGSLYDLETDELYGRARVETLDV